MSSRRLGTLALVVLALGYASFAQGIGWNQLAHFSLVRALADGTAVVDPYRDETGDVAWHDGHYYSAKAPGLAFATLPAYLVLDATGLKDQLSRVPGAADSTVGTLWALGLVGCVLPALAMLLLVRRLADTVEPGLGVAAALALGLGTLVLPFATLFFAHVLAAALGFAAFAALWLRGGQTVWALAAGVAAGLAVVADYPLAVVGALVGAYALSRSIRSGVAYAAGTLLGVAPLLAYQWWAFGSPTQLAYDDAVLVGGASGHDVLGANSSGFFGVGTPSFSVAVELLFAPVGLLRLSPVLALAAVGVALLYRRAFRAEALLIGGVAVSYVVYNAGYYQPFGGFVPGPRFLVPMLPFLAVALVTAFRRMPLTTLVLAAISTALMTVVTITGPLLAFDGRWHERLLDGWFGGRSLLVVLPFVVLIAAASFLAVRAARQRLSEAEAPTAALAVGVWLLLWILAPERLEGWSGESVALVIAVAAAGVALGGGLRYARPHAQ
jgi:hypothetical protein